MPDEPLFPVIPEKYDEWMALYFRNRLTSAYASSAGDPPPADMEQLLERAALATTLAGRPDVAA